ncbi:sulfatase [Actinomadura kijaniata]|uniref:sulfatase n=1 Tax=Actinomadura kijaniata TaxID=46161 RepID=UPI0009FCFF98|nr:sulfatase [Actinomadura kijaniata]
MSAGRWRRVVSWVVTGAALAFVLFALLLPNRVGRVAPEAFVRVPVEGVCGLGALLLLRGRWRKAAAVLGGTLLGVVLVVKVLDMGFHEVLVRPWDPVLDWAFVGAGWEFFTASYGGTFAGVGAVVAGIVAVVLMALSSLRVAGVAGRNGDVAGRVVIGLWAVWTAGTVFGTQFVPGVPVASRDTARLAVGRALKVRDGLRDKRAFARESRADAFRGVPGGRMLEALRGKDVVIAFVESYGRSAVQDPRYARRVGAVLDAGTERLRRAEVGARSAFLTSSTAGGGSWLAHATLLSGVWIDSQQRYRALVSGDRLTLNGAFRRAGWRTSAFMPAITRAWPEGGFFEYGKVYDARNLGYRGPRFAYATMPDQYTLSAVQRFERDAHAGPVMVETALVSSHAPWAAVPNGVVDWRRIGDGSVFNGQGAGLDARMPADVRGAYRRSIEYSLNTLISYAETHGDDDLVLVFLGDHQPAPLITGENAGRDVPVTVVARDRKVLDRIAGWGWRDGLRPGPDAPVWSMRDFRDRFLTAFGSRPGPNAHR